jgi:hypothetical protein
VAKWFIGPNVVSDKVMSPTEAAYFAGFIDGEGSVGIYKAKRKEQRSGYRLQPALSVANTNVEALKTIQRMCGNGRLIQSTNHAHPNHKPGYILRFTANQMRHLLPQVKPYLLIKAQQAEYVLQFLASMKNGRNVSDEEWAEKHRLRDAVCALNARGVKVSEAVN